ncbi:MAG: hypothetical protein Q9171_006403 [Xanthocarpia ochracea]
MLLVNSVADNVQKRTIHRIICLLLALLGSFWASGWACFQLRDMSIPDSPTSLLSPVEAPKDTLIVYAYHETNNARRNAEFFIRHGLHDSADFIFIINGESVGLDTLLPPDAENIKVVRRNNSCYDIGSYGEALKGLGDSIGQYKRFILLNASIRGPFIPHWSKECWSDAYLGRLTDQVKLVGMTYNCEPYDRHVQSMILATDNVGLGVLLDPASECLSTCPNGWQSAVEVEVRITGKIKQAGYKVDAMMQEFQGQADFANSCKGKDRLWEGAYPDGQMNGPGSFLGTAVTMFVETRAGKEDDKELQWYTANPLLLQLCLDEKTC